LAQTALYATDYTEKHCYWTLNGPSFGFYPSSVNIRALLHLGDNEIQVIVVNSLTNYLSTVQLPKVPGAQIHHYPPIPAGLIGPVILTYETDDPNK